MRQIDFFFSYGSTYSYLSVMRVEAVATAAGVKLRWRPFRLRTIMTELNSRPIGNPVKLKYMWRDLERRAEQHRIPFNGIPPYPIDHEALAHRVGIVAANEGWCPEYSKAIYTKWFLEHKDPGVPDHLRPVLEGLGKDPKAVVTRAESQESHDRLKAETDVARALGIFGSPNFVVGNEFFWGDDRLEIAVHWKVSAAA
jgi:2-hydroxychromene-2-carboxylate isomerase